MSERLTRAEEHAILTALGSALAGEVIDGYDDDSDEERAIRRAMLSAQTKLWRRQEAREARA